jgi:hypothetical protein
MVETSEIRRRRPWGASDTVVRSVTSVSPPLLKRFPFVGGGAVLVRCARHLGLVSNEAIVMGVSFLFLSSHEDYYRRYIFPVGYRVFADVTFHCGVAGH